MSTSRGNPTRKRPQKHQNRTAFRNNLHDTSGKTKFLNSLEVSGVCKRCKDIIEWKIKYKKYKPLNVPSKCVGCEEKAVRHAYHVLCNKCSKEKKVCAKCFTPMGQIEEQLDQNQNAEIQTMLKTLPERKRRTLLRFISKQQDGEKKMTPEALSHVKDEFSKMKMQDDDDVEDDFDDFSSDDDDEAGSSDDEVK